MESSFCSGGHEVWWAELNGERLAFVRFTRGYDLIDDRDLHDGRVMLAHARPLRYCFRLHSDVCDREEFTAPRRALTARRFAQIIE